jgi:hypothetical protein
MKKILLLAALSTSALSLGIADASAQYAEGARARDLSAKYAFGANDTPQRALSIYQRSRPEFATPPMRAGGYQFVPQIGIELTYDDNIFATQNNEQVDWKTAVSPSLQILSDWNRHALNFVAAGEFAGYREFDNQDYSEYLVGVNGRYDIQRNLFARGDFSYQNLVEGRGLPNAVAGGEPTEFSVLSTGVGLVSRGRRIGFDLGGRLITYDYKNNGAVINNTRDRTDSIGSLKLSYEIVPEFDAFVRGTVNKRDYRVTAPQARGSKGYSIVAGTDIDLTGIVTGEIYAGYAAQDYDFTNFSTVNVFVYGGSLLWTPTGLTSVKLSTDRGVEDSTLNNISSYVQTRYALRVEHELRRNLLINANGEYRIDDFEGIPSTNRKDKSIAAGTGATYIINRSVTWNADYQHINRDSNFNTSDYSRNIVKTSFDFKF